MSVSAIKCSKTALLAENIIFQFMYTEYWPDIHFRRTTTSRYTHGILARYSLVTLQKGYWTKSTGNVFSSRVACVSTNDIHSLLRSRSVHTYIHTQGEVHRQTDRYRQTNTDSVITDRQCTYVLMRHHLLSTCQTWLFTKLHNTIQYKPISPHSSVIVGSTRLSTVGNWAFPVAAAGTWNSFPNHITSAPSMRSCLKYHLFCNSFPSTSLYRARTVTSCHFGRFNHSCYLLTYLLKASQSQPAWLALGRHVHLCRVADNTVWSHMASDVP